MRRVVFGERIPFRQNVERPRFRLKYRRPFVPAFRVVADGSFPLRPAQKAGVLIAISFKNPVDAQQAQASVTREEDGYYYLYLDFGPGTDLPDEPEPAEGGAPQTQPSE